MVLFLSSLFCSIDLSLFLQQRRRNIVNLHVDYRKYCWAFYLIALNQYISFGKTDISYMESSNSRTQYAFPFIYIIFDLFHWHFKIFSIQVLYVALTGGLGIILQSKGSPVQFPVTAHAWVLEQVRFPIWGAQEAIIH